MTLKHRFRKALFAILLTTLSSCNDDKVYLMDESCQCAPIEAPSIDYVRRSGNDLLIKECCYANLGLNTVELEQGVSNYEIVDIGFWEVRRFPFEFHRESRGREYIIYYGERIDLLK